MRAFEFYRFKYVLVEFQPTSGLDNKNGADDNGEVVEIPEAEVASSAWLIDQTSVWWPKYRTNAAFQKLLKAHATPNSVAKVEWERLSCRIIGEPQGKIFKITQIRSKII